MTRVAATLLALEAVVVLLAIPAAVSVSEVDATLAIPVGAGVAVGLVVGAALVRKGRIGYVIGSVMQALTVATGFVVTVMFFLGGLFAVLWLVLLRLGPRVESGS